jgi:hypothetical protein
MAGSPLSGTPIYGEAARRPGSRGWADRPLC